MKRSPQYLIARLLWFAPILLFFLALNQLKVALDLRETLATGTPAVAEVTDYEKVDRADITYGYVSLRATLADGRVIEHEKMSLPYTLLHPIEGAETLDVLVQPGAAQDIVITSIAQTQWKIAAMQAAISLGGFLMFGIGVFWWNRYLHRQGDPAARMPATA